MSTYMHALRRFGRDASRSAAPAGPRTAAVDGASATTALARLPERASEPSAPQPFGTPPRTFQGIDLLFERLRALPRRDVARTVVVTGVESRDRARAVAAALVRCAQGHGMPALLVTMCTAPAGPALVPDDAAGPVLVLDGTAAADARRPLDAWLSAHAAPTGLVVVDAPPLTDDGEAALVGAACDGLLVIAETLVTDRTALEHGVERARLAGARVLGAVCVHRRPAPRWLARLSGARRPRGGV